VLSVSSLFLTRVGVYVGVWVCIRTHTRTAQMGYSDVSPVVGMRHLEGPKNPDGLNLRMYVFVYVYKVPAKTPKIENSNLHGFELHRPQARVLNYCYK